MLAFPARHPNAYTGSPLDRAAYRRDDDAWIAARLADPASLVVPLWRSRTLLRGLDNGCPEVVYLSGATAETVRLAGGPWAFLGLLADTAVFAVDLSAADDPASLLPETLGRFADLRATWGTPSPTDASVLAHARALLHWRGRHRFCGVCAAPCEPRSAGHVLACTGCGAQHFPRTDPAVIMLVHRGDRCLLGHSQRFPTTTMYSTLAGFVEPGESLEEAVAREVLEETGVVVGEMTYHSSQPWPFPANVMLGFHAHAETEAITVNAEELRDARWFTRAELRNGQSLGVTVPPPDSIARRLIDDWLEAAP
jgi:NAD+ diphosphatase